MIDPNLLWIVFIPNEDDECVRAENMSGKKVIIYKNQFSKKMLERLNSYTPDIGYIYGAELNEDNIKKPIPEELLRTGKENKNDWRKW